MHSARRRTRSSMRSTSRLLAALEIGMAARLGAGSHKFQNEMGKEAIEGKNAATVSIDIVTFRDINIDIYRIDAFDR